MNDILIFKSNLVYRLGYNLSDYNCFLVQVFYLTKTIEVLKDRLCEFPVYCISCKGSLADFFSLALYIIHPNLLFDLYFVLLLYFLLLQLSNNCRSNPKCSGVEV